MKEVLEVIVKNLVDNPEMVVIKESESNNLVTLKLNVADEDMGKIIGKQGKVAKAIRTVLKSAAIHRNKRVNVEIV